MGCSPDATGHLWFRTLNALVHQVLGGDTPGRIPELSLLELSCLSHRNMEF